MGEEGVGEFGLVLDAFESVLHDRGEVINAVYGEVAQAAFEVRPEASFWGVRFKSSACFTDTVFAGKAKFTKASFDGKKPAGLPRLGEVTTDFRSVTFALGVPLEVAPFVN